jgi:hypothetical protein
LPTEPSPQCPRFFLRSPNPHAASSRLREWWRASSTCAWPTPACTPGPFGHGVGIGAGCVDDRNPPSRGGRNVNVVHTHAELHKTLQLGCPGDELSAHRGQTDGKIIHVGGGFIHPAQGILKQFGTVSEGSSNVCSSQPRCRSASVMAGDLPKAGEVDAMRILMTSPALRPKPGPDAHA